MKKQTLIIIGAAIVVLAVIVIVVAISVARCARRNSLSELIREAQRSAQADSERTPVPTATPNATGMENMLKGDSFVYKLSAARLLGARTDIPVKERARLLIDAIGAEVETPSEDAVVKDSYLNGGQVLRLTLVRSLGELDKRGLDNVRAAVEEAEGITREHMLVALTYMGDKDARGEVRGLVTDSSDPVVRMDAARALGIVKDKAAVPMLTEALQDEFLVHARDSLGEFSAYPVREQAAAALGLLGVTVTRGADGRFTAEE